MYEEKEKLFILGTVTQLFGENIEQKWLFRSSALLFGSKNIWSQLFFRGGIKFEVFNFFLCN